METIDFGKSKLVKMILELFTLLYNPFSLDTSNNPLILIIISYLFPLDFFQAIINP